jgi:transcriptional regulator of nitric oxide reductase
MLLSYVVRARRAVAVAVTLLLLVAPTIQAKVFFSQSTALGMAFPDADRIEKTTHILTPEQVSDIERRARSKVQSRLVAIHSAWRGDELLGYAHIDVHEVRTKPEGFMVTLGPEGVVRGVRVLAFYEPIEYLPSSRWYDLFAGKRRDDGLRLGRDVDAVTGATLSARAATEGVRRMLAYYDVLLRG